MILSQRWFPSHLLMRCLRCGIIEGRRLFLIAAHTLRPRRPGSLRRKEASGTLRSIPSPSNSNEPSIPRRESRTRSQDRSNLRSIICSQYPPVRDSRTHDNNERTICQPSALPNQESTRKAVTQGTANISSRCDQRGRRYPPRWRPDATCEKGIGKGVTEFRA